jgi:hypothetical protein
MISLFPNSSSLGSPKNLDTKLNNSTKDISLAAFTDISLSKYSLGISLNNSIQSI